MDRSKAKGTTSSANILPNYRLGKTLGIGAFGKVKLALHIVTGIKVAIKILDRQSIDDSAAEKVRREINILRLLSHPHIVRLYEVIETRLKIYVVMEYVSSGELFDYITENGRLQEDEARHFFQQIISGVQCCHNHLVVHRDLKPENLLLDSKRNIKIADFGLSNIMRDGHFLKTSCGSPNYAAPEVISKRLYAGPEVDMWSCGVILYALLCASLPFDDDNLSGLYAKIKSGVYTLPHHLSHDARDLIRRMLVVNPINRLSIGEIFQHCWFRQRLPRYIAIVPSINAADGTDKIKEDTILEMGRMGFDVDEVIGSLRNGSRNKATVTYNLLLDNRNGVRCSHLENEQLDSSTRVDCPEIYIRPLAPVQSNWALGFQSQSSPRDTMRGVLKILEKLNVKWKEIGDYNMKCLWIRKLNDCPAQAQAKTNDVNNLELSITSVNRQEDHRLQNTVKFEIQLYKASQELYLLDLQRLHGSPFLFLEICAALFQLSTA